MCIMCRFKYARLFETRRDVYRIATLTPLLTLARAGDEEMMMESVTFFEIRQVVVTADNNMHFLKVGETYTDQQRAYEEYDRYMNFGHNVFLVQVAETVIQ